MHRTLTTNISTGATTYQTANVTGSHPSTVTMKRGSGARAPATGGVVSMSGGRGRRGRRRRRGAVVPRAGQRPYPDQPDDEHVEHDQRLPHVQVRPLEHLVVPLPEVEQADHAQ